MGKESRDVLGLGLRRLPSARIGAPQAPSSSSPSDSDGVAELVAPAQAGKKAGFFLAMVEAQITFEVDASGRAVALVLHQAGEHHGAKRID